MGFGGRRLDRDSRPEAASATDCSTRSAHLCAFTTFGRSRREHHFTLYSCVFRAVFAHRRELAETGSNPVSHPNPTRNGTSAGLPGVARRGPAGTGKAREAVAVARRQGRLRSRRPEGGIHSGRLAKPLSDALGGRRANDWQANDWQTNGWIVTRFPVRIRLPVVRLPFLGW